jgi:predicted DNA-binding transcriptional regulator YafY
MNSTGWAAEEVWMRADRLLAMLMLLQTRGRVTARQLAAELEVSERTIYRDVTALSSAGIPIYTEGGPGGGIALVDSYQTDLTGLRPEEAQALSMLNVPEPLVRLGVGAELKAALLKLSVALSPSGRERQAQVRSRIHLDAAWWFQPEEPTPYLQTLQQAVWKDQMVRITSRGAFNALSDQVVAPLGLVAKASIWYLVFSREGYIRARRVSHIISAEMLPQTFTRPADFDLAAFWQKWCADFESDRPQYTVRVLVAPALSARLPRLLQESQPDFLNKPPPPVKREGWQAMTLTFETFEAARARLLGYGGAIEVLEPPALRASVADYARQTRALYEP